MGLRLEKGRETKAWVMPRSFSVSLRRVATRGWSFPKIGNGGRKMLWLIWHKWCSRLHLVSVPVRTGITPQAFSVVPAPSSHTHMCQSVNRTHGLSLIHVCWTVWVHVKEPPRPLGPVWARVQDSHLCHLSEHHTEALTSPRVKRAPSDHSS